MRYKSSNYHFDLGYLELTLIELTSNSLLCAFSIICCRLSRSSAISDCFLFPSKGLICRFLKHIFNALVG